MSPKKFRGIMPNFGQEGDGKWAYGHYCKITGTHFIVPECADFDQQEEDIIETSGFIEVIPETVGQSTGEKDVQDIEIYAGDITNNGVVVWIADEGLSEFIGWHLQDTYKNKYGIYEIHSFYWSTELTEIIGNIHENP